MMLILVEQGEISPDSPHVKDDNKLIPELLKKFKIDEPKVLEIDIRVLTASDLSGSSHTLPLQTDMSILKTLLILCLANFLSY